MRFRFACLIVGAYLVCASYAYGGLTSLGPISGMEATGDKGMITSIDGVAVENLILGSTTFPNAPKHSQYPSSGADNFNLDDIGSADDQPWFETVFDQGVTVVYMIENNGNDGGSVQALDAAGEPVGTVLNFSSGDYFKTEYKTSNNQVASGIVLTTDSAIYGIRVTPPTGGAMGFDPVCVCGIAGDSEPSITKATEPVPDDGASGLKACQVTELSWTKPEPNRPGDPITCTVFFGTQPNKASRYYNMAPLPDDDDTDNTVAVSVEDGVVYYWWVDCNDPSIGVTEGTLWSFDTIPGARTLGGDFNDDGVVGFMDCSIFAADWLADCSPADIWPSRSGDGIVAVDDFCLLADRWLYDEARDIMVTANGVISDSYGGIQLVWTSGTAVRSEASVDFGLSLPHQYDPASDANYPLVLYLHGAGARGSNINKVLQRQTAREFAWHGQTGSEYAAFVVAPQVPSGELWAGAPWANGPYEQSEQTYTDSMKLTDALLTFLVDTRNNTVLADFGMDAGDVDTERVYVVGDSMGAYGTWDIVGRHPGLFAAAISASGSGPKNRLAEILETPFWAIHGIGDSTVPNALPSPSDPDGAGSLGMLGLIDGSFDNTSSTALVKLDDYQASADDPTVADRLIYTQFPSGYGHATVAMQWTTLVPGVKEWLFAHPSGENASVIDIDPATSFVATGDGGTVVSINGVSVDEMILGTTSFPNPPRYAQYPPEGADDFDLSTASAGDDQPYVTIMYDQPVTTIFIAENGGNDTGYAQALDVNGDPVGDRVAWGQASFLMSGYVFLSQQGAVMVISADEPIYGVQFLPPEGGVLAIDPMSAPAVPAQ